MVPTSIEELHAAVTTEVLHNELGCVSVDPTPSRVLAPKHFIPGTEEEKPASKGPYKLTVVLSVPATLAKSELR